MENKDKFSVLVNNSLDCEYIQKMAFKAGYTRIIKGKEKKLFNLKAEQFIFRKERKNMDCFDGKRFNSPYKEGCLILSFPKDAEKIHQIFTTPEPVYKVGDYVVLVDERPKKGWADKGDMDNLLGSTQKIIQIDGEDGEVIFELKEPTGWFLVLSDIARHATEKEIKKYKEGDDVYIGEHKVKFDIGYIEIGCKSFSHDVVKAFNSIYECVKGSDHNFIIDRSGVMFKTREGAYPVSGKQLDKIIKKAGIE